MVLVAASVKKRNGWNSDPDSIELSIFPEWSESLEFNLKRNYYQARHKYTCQMHCTHSP